MRNIEKRLPNPLRYVIYRTKWWLAENYGWRFKAPLHVDLELSKDCNLACTMCSHGSREWKRNFGKGQMETFDALRYISEAASLGVYSIKLNGRGEPGLHRDISRIVKRAKREGILEVQFNTNALAWSRKRIFDVAAAGLDRVIISCDGATKDTYEAIRVGGSWEGLITRYNDWLEARDEHPQLQIRVQLTHIDQPEEELEQFREIFKDADEVLIKPVRGAYPRNRKLCGQPFQRLFIGHDGTKYACCNCWYEESRHGVQSPTIASAWDYNLVWQVMARDPDEGEPCKSCLVWSSYKQ